MVEPDHEVGRVRERLERLEREVAGLREELAALRSDDDRGRNGEARSEGGAREGDTRWDVLARASRQAARAVKRRRTSHP